jgi:hexulose-6-phosphate isomerase
MIDFTRRQFLQAAGALAAAGALPASLAAGDEQPAGHGLRKALKYGMIGGEGAVLEKFALAKKVGFEGIDVDRKLDHRDVLEAQDKTGLVVHGVVAYDHWRQPLSSPDPEVRAAGLESFLGAIRDAKAYGGTTVLLVVGKVEKGVSYADAYTNSQAEIKKAIPLAGELGIRILFENVWNNFLLSPLEFARYIDEFDTPVVGAYFDVGNVVRYGWPEHWIRILGKRIGKLDIKEYSRELESTKGTREGFNVELGDGDCDWPAVMAALGEIGFSGWATAEVRGGDESRLREVSERMTRIFGA